MQNHHNLIVWQKAHALSVTVYRVARGIGRRDRSGLASQANRAAKSISANITEGCNRSSNKDFARFLQIAIASASELEDHILYARDVDLLSPNEAGSIIGKVVEVRRMLYGLIKKLNEDR